MIDTMSSLIEKLADELCYASHDKKEEIRNRIKSAKIVLENILEDKDEKE